MLSGSPQNARNEEVAKVLADAGGLASSVPRRPKIVARPPSQTKVAPGSPRGTQEPNDGLKESDLTRETSIPTLAPPDQKNPHQWFRKPLPRTQES